MVRCQAEKSAEENERAFLEAMGEGRDESSTPAIVPPIEP
jgi:hypothetical protein